jgi:hypothetical protein
VVGLATLFSGLWGPQATGPFDFPSTNTSNAPHRLPYTQSKVMAILSVTVYQNKAVFQCTGYRMVCWLL